MSEEDPIERFVADAIEDYRDGELDDRQLQELRDLLLNNPRARRAFLEHNFMSHLISSVHLREGATDNSPEPVGLNPNGSADAHLNRSLLKFWIPLAVAASVLILAGIYILPLNRENAIAVKPAGGPNSAVADLIALRPESSEAPVAVLVESADAKWNTKGLSTTSGMPLRTGWLDLVSGVASIRFNSGAIATLVGPARFQLIDDRQAFLAQGSVIANVPPSATGFQIHTMAMQLTDLGTEFAVRVGDSDSAEVHVIDGLVEVECETETDAMETYSLRKHDARRFAARSEPETLEIDKGFADQIVASRASQRIGYYTFTSVEQDGDQWETDSSAEVVGGDDVQFHDFFYKGVVPGPVEYERNLNRWSFKNWRPEYRVKKFHVGFKVSAPAGKTIQLNGLSLELFRAGGNDLAELAPQDGVVRVSSDGFETFRRFVLLEDDTFVLEPKFVSADLGTITAAEEFEFRFLFRGQSKARAIRLDEVTLDLDIVSPQ